MVSLAAYQPDIAQNLGNIIRSCACFDAPLHVIEPCGFPFSIKALRRAAMDYYEDCTLYHHMDWQSFYKTVKEPGGAVATNRLVLLTTKGNTTPDKFRFRAGDVVLLGQESAGVPESVAEACDVELRIPMPGGGRSLNVSNAAAILLYEANRQMFDEAV